MLTLLIDSNLYFNDNGIHPNKKNNVQKIIDLCSDKDNEIDALICPGDLTRHGMDKFFLQCCLSEQREVSNFIEEYLDPLSKHVNVYLCRGDHDETTKWWGLYKPLDRLVIDKHGDLRYTFELEGYKFICLDIYLDGESLGYLANIFLTMENKEQPVILFWHKNLTESSTEYWSARLYDFITKFKINVALIIIGDAHVNQRTSWHGIDVVTGGGEGLVKYVIGCDTISFQILGLDVFDGL